MNALTIVAFACLAACASASTHGVLLGHLGVGHLGYGHSHSHWGDVGPSGVVTGAGASGPSGVVTGAGASGPSGHVNGHGAVGPAGQHSGHGWGLGHLGHAGVVVAAAPAVVVGHGVGHLGYGLGHLGYGLGHGLGHGHWW